MLCRSANTPRSTHRKGLAELENAVDEGKIEVVLVKDLSRLGQHRTQTALFIDHLRENKVKVISVTEGSISDANLRMLVNGVTIHQNEDKSPDGTFEMNGDFTNSTMIVLEPMFEEMF